jgi:hypothetical protein
MKLKCLFLSVICIVSLSATLTAQSSRYHYVRTEAGKFISEGQFDTATTTSATPLICDTMKITDNTAGIIEVTAVGQAANGDGITGKLIYRYSKASGTLTFGTATAASAITADTGLSGGTFALATTSFGNAKLTLTGKASVTVKWWTQIQPLLKR